MEFNVGKTVVGGDKTVVIAEAGVNHLKDLEIARKLIETGAKAGADIMKFQTYSADKLTTRSAERFWSWQGERVTDGSQFDSYSLLETPEYEFTSKLAEICKENSVEFMSTPFDIEAALMLDDIGCDAYKLASGDITNLPLIRCVAKLGKPIFLSTGASSLLEIETAYKTIKKINSELPICIMHCTLCYPTRSKNANLSALNDIALNFPDCILGLSDHTIGPLIPAASILYGVKAIEKHYTYDNSLPDSADHWLSINEDGLKEMVSMLRTLEQAKGNGFKAVLPCEEIARKNARRSLVTNGAIKKGEKFNEKNIIAKRPGTGISPLHYDELLGLTCAENLEDDQLIQPNHIKEDASFKPITEEMVLNKSKNL